MRGSIVGVNVGSAGSLRHGSREIETAFVKHAVEQPVEIGPLGLPGDEHVYEDHGGPDMALLVYPIEHYDHWRSVGLDLPATGAMAENLTTRGLVETDVRIGDVIACGTARIQVTQPRSPCFKLAARFQRRSLPVEVQTTGFTGYLLRVLEPGVVAPGDVFEVVERATDSMTVERAGRILNVNRSDLDGAREMLAISALGSVTRRTLEARVAAGGYSVADTARLYLDDAL